MKTKKSAPTARVSKMISQHLDGIATVLIEPNSLFREGLLRILSETRFRVVASAADCNELAKHIIAGEKPSLLIIGASEDCTITAKELTRAKEVCPGTRSVVLNGHYSQRALSIALSAGADAYLVRTTTSTESLIKSLELVMLGENVFSAGVLSLVQGLVNNSEIIHELIEKPAESIERQDLISHRLSTREVETLACLVQGYSNKLIARRFDIAEATVKVHIKAILRKIRAGNRTQAAIWAMNHLPPSVLTNGYPANGSAINVVDFTTG
jgi:two-component system nitrate/nitrite response regulator NarL